MEKVIYQRDKIKWLLRSLSFTAKLELLFVLTLEKAFNRGFILKPTERVSVLLKNSTRVFQNSPPLERSTCFYVTIRQNFQRF